MKKDYEEPREITSAFDDFQIGLTGAEEISGRIYRLYPLDKTGGRPMTEFVGRVEEKVDEDFIGREFGPGSYRVVYRIKRGGEPAETKQFNVNIGAEYAKYRKGPETAPEAPKTAAPVLGGGFDLGGLLGSLTADKMAAIGIALKQLKEFLAPPPPPQPAVDLTRLLEIMLSNNKQQSVSDAILIKAMDGMQKQAAAPSVIEQLRQMKEIKEAFSEELENENNQGDNDEMDFLINKAFQILPGLLAKKNNDYRAVGQEVSNNTFINGIIQDNPELAGRFFEEAIKKYGVENAQKLAEGFGYNIQPQTDAVKAV